MIRSKLQCILFCLIVCISAQAYPISLDGYWRFELDPLDAGVQQQWFNRQLRSYSKLPGILQSDFFGGNPITTDTPWVLSLYDRYWYLREDYKAYTERGKVKVPFLSQPPRHYLGAAWYQRDIEIPRNMFGRRVLLTLERPHWETTVWIDEKKIGSDKSLVTPHVYDLGNISIGRHRLTIRIDNRMIMPYRPDAHSVSDSVGATWNGIIGKIQIDDTARVWIDDAQVFPSLTQHTMLIKVKIGNATGHSGQGTLTAIWPEIGVVPVTWDENGGTAEVEVPIRLEAENWDEFHPKKQPLRLWLKGSDVDEYKDMTVGLRDFHAEGNQFILNGHPINFRGTVNSGDFPLTGYPPTDVKAWQTLFELCKKWGLNHMRFHSWCPPEAAFEAADQVGFYLQPEPGMWNEISPGTPMERMLYDETERMIRAYGNHPSFMLLSAGNEPKGEWQESLSRWVDYFHKRDPRRLYASGSGHTERDLENITKGTDYLVVHRINHKMLRRESGWFGNDFAESLADINIPVIAHEVGQWAAYPDYGIINKFQKAYLRPGNLEIFRDSMLAQGLLDRNKDFAESSGLFQFECYKEEIEANLRTPGLSGFQLLDLHDYLGQGTSFVGLLDAFWETKPYASADEFKEFCNSTVPLARLSKLIYTSSERFEADIELAHFGTEPMENTLVVWRIDETPMPKGEWPPRSYPVGKNIHVGRISASLIKAVAPGEHRLTVTVGPADWFDPLTGKIRPDPKAKKGETYFENHWSFWVYPEMVPAEFVGTPDCPLSRSREIFITRSWDEAEKKLARGGRVLFVPQPTDLDWTSPPIDRVPIFWNRQMNPAWSRSLGLAFDLKDSKGGALGFFPTLQYLDWRWGSLISNVRAINLDNMPPRLAPVVSAIDDWNRNYKLAVMFECAVGDGKLLVSAIDISKENDVSPIARQLRYSVLNYMSTDCFQPNVPVSAGEIRSLLFDTRIMSKLGASAKLDGAPAGAAIDGDPNTFVSTGEQDAPMREQAELTITFPAPVTISGVVLMPRQNSREHEGEIKEAVISVSEDGSVWNDVQRAYLGSTFAPQRIMLSRAVTTKYLKLVSLSGFGDDKTTSLAELAVIYAGPKRE
jgi:beta-galactosidase